MNLQEHWTSWTTDHLESWIDWARFQVPPNTL